MEPWKLYFKLQANYRHQNQIWPFFDAFQVAVVDIQLPREMNTGNKDGLKWVTEDWYLIRFQGILVGNSNAAILLIL